MAKPQPPNKLNVKKHKTVPLGLERTDPVKIMMLGDHAGKTRAVVRLLHNWYYEDFDFTIVDTYRHRLGAVWIELYDTGSSTEYDEILTNITRECHAALVMFNVCAKREFSELSRYFDMVEKGEQRIPFVLVGTQVDRINERVVTVDEAQTLAAEHGVPYMEISAKEGQNIREVFEEAVSQARAVWVIATENENTEDSSKRCAVQ